VEEEEDAKLCREWWNEVNKVNAGLLEANKKLMEEAKEANKKLGEELKEWEEQFKQLLVLLEKMFDLHKNRNRLRETKDKLPTFKKFPKIKFSFPEKNSFIFVFSTLELV